MKRRISLFQKIKTIAALAVVFLLVLATNMMDNSHFEIVRKTLSTVYEDRLVVKDYIYKISKQLQIKERVFYTNDQDLFPLTYSSTNDSLSTLIVQYTTTKLTTKEAKYLESLQRRIVQLQRFEKEFFEESSRVAELELTDNISKLFSDIRSDLDVLSQIQLEEGKRQINQSNRAIATSDMISKFEIIALIIIGVIIQLIILYKSPKLKGRDYE